MSTKKSHAEAALKLRYQFPHGTTLADLLERLGGVSPERIRIVPPPGCATGQDMLEIDAHEDRLFELIDGTLVEKGTDPYDGMISTQIICEIGSFLNEHDLGVVTGGTGPMEILPGIVRLPDVAFTHWDKFGGKGIPREPIPRLVPDLVVDVLAPRNTPGELKLKLDQFFRAGVRLMWVVDPRTRTARVYHGPETWRQFEKDGVLDGEDVLPGFRLRFVEAIEYAKRLRPY